MECLNCRAGCQIRPAAKLKHLIARQWCRSTDAACSPQVAFLQQAVPMLNSLSFVERYAWYFLSPDQTYDGQNGLPLDTASLYTSSGSETPTGAAYRPY